MEHKVVDDKFVFAVLMGKDDRGAQGFFNGDDAVWADMDAGPGVTHFCLMQQRTRNLIRRAIDELEFFAAWHNEQDIELVGDDKLTEAAINYLFAVRTRTELDVEDEFVMQVRFASQTAVLQAL